MSVIAIIPARYQSSRFPGKPLVMIKGKSMVQRVWEKASLSNSIAKVIVATDDERIFNHVKAFGGEVMMTSPKHRNGTERIAEVMRKQSQKFDYVLNIQGDEPFVKGQQIEMLCNIIEREEFQIASLAKQIDTKKELDSPNVVKVVMSKQQKALYFSRYAIPFNRSGDTQIAYYKHIGMYAFEASTLQKLIALEMTPLEQAESLEQLRWLEAGFSIGMGISEFDSVGIDTPEDLEHALTYL